MERLQGLSSCRCGILVLMVFFSGSLTKGQESVWPQWRGPNRDGVSTERGIPIEWSATQNILWSTPIEGRGHSSPVVWGDRVFLTTDIQGDVIPGAEAPKHVRDGETYLHPATGFADRRHTLKVLAIDAKTGEVLWTHTAHDGRVFDNRHRNNTYASPTIATDGKLVYVYFGSQGLFCYDFEGELIWTVDFGGILTWGHGHGTSPLLYEDSLILQIDQDQGERSFLVAIDKTTGQERWKTKRDTRLNYSSPILVEAHGRTDLVTTSYHNVIAYDPTTGKERWRHEGFLGNAVPTPVANNKRVFVASGYPDKLLRAIEVPKEGTSAAVGWEYRKGTAYVSSPLLYDGYLYLVSDKGILTCLEPKTGNVMYEGGRLPIPTSVKASPIAWEGKILISGQDGDYFVIQAGPTHDVLSTNSIGGVVYASPAIAGGKLFLRAEDCLYAIGITN